MLGRLLGAVTVPKPEEIDQRARVATESFLKIHGRPNGGRVRWRKNPGTVEAHTGNSGWLALHCEDADRTNFAHD